MSDEDESTDIVSEMNAFGLNTDILQQIFAAKQGDPNQFASFWEMDENDIEEETMEEIQKDPKKKILWVAENNHLDKVREMLGTDRSLVTSRDNDGYTPLHRASYNGHVDMIKVLVEHGADVLAQTNDGWHPIHSASRWNQASAVLALLEHGADVNAQTQSGQTALHIASSDKDCGECLKVLLSADNVNLKLKNSLGETAYQICQRTSENCLLFEQRRDFHEPQS